MKRVWLYSWVDSGRRWLGGRWNSALVVEFAEEIPEGALGLLECWEHQARRLRVMTCKLATPMVAAETPIDDVLESVELFYVWSAPFGLSAAQAGLMARLTELRDAMPEDPPRPRPDPIPRIEHIDLVDIQPRPPDRSSRSKRIRHLDLDIAPPPPVSKRFRRLDYD